MPTTYAFLRISYTYTLNSFEARSASNGGCGLSLHLCACVLCQVFRMDMILLAVIVGVNMVAFYLTMAFFMIPLERLANRLKAKEKV